MCISLPSHLPSLQSFRCTLIDAADKGSSSWIPAIHMGDLGFVSGFWLQPGAALVVGGIWVNEAVDKRSLFLSLPFQINKINIFKKIIL